MSAALEIARAEVESAHQHLGSLTAARDDLEEFVADIAAAVAALEA